MGGVSETNGLGLSGWSLGVHRCGNYRVCWVLHGVEWSHSKWILVQDIEVSVVLRWKYVGREGGGRGRGEGENRERERKGREEGGEEERGEAGREKRTGEGEEETNKGGT